MFTSKVLEVGAVKIGITGTTLHRAKRIERIYDAGTQHPMAGKSYIETVILCKCGCKGSKNSNRIQFFANVAATCGPQVL